MGDSPNLRHRKQCIGEILKDERGTEVEIIDDEVTSLSTSQDSKSSKLMAGSSPQTDGYILTPLKERSVLTRLDVYPFVIAYGFLIFLDYCVQQNDMKQSWIPPFTLVGFPLTLMLHLGLFLLQQWDVSWRATVGYQKSSFMQSKSPRSNDESDKINAPWTHCLVEAPHIDKHHASHDSGIVAVKCLKSITPREGSHDAVMVVNFQDLIFRSRLSKSNEDFDFLLWTRNGDISSPALPVSGAPSEQGRFHRLRYPVQYPLYFYKQWRGHADMQQLFLAQQTYGANVTQIELPPFVELLQEQVLAPFFLFQVLCVLLWSLDEYWYYAIFTFFALLMFESTVAYNRLKSLERLRSHTIHTPKLIWVYRPSYPPGKHGWIQVSVAELVPGDVVSCRQINLMRKRNHEHSESRLAQKQQQLNRVPADILILNGDAVVDESLLTGESIPQLKVPIEADGSTALETELDLQEHKQSVLFGGTTLVVGQYGNSSLAHWPKPPDEGVVGMVLRTGFETAQGTLLRTMAHTQKSIDGIHTRDTYVFILLLLCCAVLSALLVWEEGRNDPTRNYFRLCLRVIIIITSVVPPELPMELSLAVTNSVADLLKKKIFCTEAFRIPVAGQVDFCCFDKTGTLTSDEMQVKGLRVPVDDTNANTRDAIEVGELMEPGTSVPLPALRIMVACHSLAVNSGNSSDSQGLESLALVGDPLEKAVLETTGYKMMRNGVLRKTGKADGPDTILIIHRFAFSSRLKRMSVLVKENGSDTTWVLTKGAPEILKTFLEPESTPSDYDELYMSHMALGQRVLAMAYRKLDPTESKQSLSDLNRESMERGLTFAGFLVLHSPIKHDSKAIVTELKASGHEVVMITGDAVLTAVEVSRQVGIISRATKAYPPTFELSYVPSKLGTVAESFLPSFELLPLLDLKEKEKPKKLFLDPSGILNLKRLVQAGDLVLCISGDTLQKLASDAVEQLSLRNKNKKQSDDKKRMLFHSEAQALLKEIVPLIAVFARHAPRQKEAVIAALNLGGHKTLMCGDGTNDTMALRRSHVGISLISSPELEAKQRRAVRLISHAMTEQKKGVKQKTKSKKSKSSLEESFRQLQEAQDELDQIDLGDASIASPFTSRVVNISCCKEVIKQGRCTLVTMLQIYKILGVNCLVNATILSKLFLHGVKQGDRQMTSLGILVAALFFFVTRGKPLPKLSKMRPPVSVLSTQALLSIFGQFAIHFTAMTIATEVALSFVDPFDPSLIPDGPFNPNTLNTCTFLINVLATVDTFAVNYRGEPFVEPLRKNKILWRSIQATYITLIVCVFEVFPPLNDLFQLAEFPDIRDNDVGERKQELHHLPSFASLKHVLLEVVRLVGFPIFMSFLMLADTAFAFLFERSILSLLARA
ncbi:phospholipid-translocating P-type ATPase, flippase [Nitzschia inconspicua]|uniref:Phospholipid-translocating P-type ATPase, flippase n=1 Tax=Nitzschia inconspicua TaxID=303405 RepID=A0A9K3KNA5_9STRA|nr:phospholipid-translocating P-type ATPase, flippase [Nitzschia inconspicua]